ncbi:copper chaperone PCu(A)C [Myceligenerans pegani]|uniref:Copper chaperone PCu(A)C n=1 Tax=Myceligenerans pegani TaxID=2776917 RepID=A0ABR9N194_9MICO|nr:copper chaperone PCu(A)C [Myceligenerans sp. TRM 65318]MBE1876787.1 copper chaperone PCu(A)C [Myceligenerans sp. TRM 65318]MBE3019058.1 copper chaperone PCu(A)C [Myceligenerans sp. TRM 65318]
MNRTIISRPRPRVLAAAAVAGLALLPAACTSGSQAAPEDTAAADTEAAALTVEDPWAKAVDEGMTAVFGTLTNASGHDVRLVSAESEAAESTELHVFVDDGGTPVMQEADGGLVIPAGEPFDLEPGGPHLMLLGVTDPLEPGEEVTVVVAAEDGSELEINAPVRSFDGANESYEPEGAEHAESEHGESTDHAAHSDDEHSGHEEDK